MANKVAAMLVMCLVLVAAVHQLPAAAVAVKTDKYSRCFSDCEEECMGKGYGYTFCEMQCDTDCYNKDVASKLNIDEYARHGWHSC